MRKTQGTILSQLIQQKFRDIAIASVVLISLSACGEKTNFYGNKSTQSDPAKETADANNPSSQDAGIAQQVTTPLDSGGADETKIDGASDGETSCQNEDGTIGELALPATIKQCLDGGHLYNFDLGECSPKTPLTADFNCDFSGVLAKMQEYGVSEASLSLINSYKEEGAKILGCSLKSDGRTLMFQHYRAKVPEEKSCDPAKKFFNTACYRFVESGESIIPSDPEAKKALVQGCFSE